MYVGENTSRPANAPWIPLRVGIHRYPERDRVSLYTKRVLFERFRQQNRPQKRESGRYPNISEGKDHQSGGPFIGLPLLLSYDKMVTISITVQEYSISYRKGEQKMKRKGRERATRHCLECPYHHQDTRPTAPHECERLYGRQIGHNKARTSPDWCPLGHLIPGRAYPVFTPGTDPRYSKEETKRFQRMCKPR